MPRNTIVRQLTAALGACSFLAASAVQPAAPQSFQPIPLNVIREADETNNHVELTQDLW